MFHSRAHELAVDVRVPDPLWRTALLYLRLGVAHILTGYDHLSFLLALLLAAGLRTRTALRSDVVAQAATPRQALRSTVAIVSAFTVAHSLTLFTQVLHPGWLSTRWVEPAIALSVAYVGFENLVPRAPRALYGRWLLVFGFGLVHGLGFASVLREIGLPRRGLVLSLLCFNLGVELGQLLVVGLVLPMVVASRPPRPARVRALGTSARLRPHRHVRHDLAGRPAGGAVKSARRSVTALRTRPSRPGSDRSRSFRTPESPISVA